MARQNTPKSYRSSTSRGLKPNETYNSGNGRVFVKAPAGYPGKKYIGNRYIYRYQLEAWKQTGRVADGKKNIVHHTTKKFDDGKFSRHDDRNVTIASRRAHYGHGHGRPFSRPGGRKPRSRGL